MFALHLIPNLDVSIKLRTTARQLDLDWADVLIGVALVRDGGMILLFDVGKLVLDFIVQVAAIANPLLKLFKISGEEDQGYMLIPSGAEVREQLGWDL